MFTIAICGGPTSCTTISARRLVPAQSRTFIPVLALFVSLSLSGDPLFAQNGGNGGGGITESCDEGGANGGGGNDCCNCGTATCLPVDGYEWPLRGTACYQMPGWQWWDGYETCDMTVGSKTWDPLCGWHLPVTCEHSEEICENWELAGLDYTGRAVGKDDGLRKRLQGFLGLTRAAAKSNGCRSQLAANRSFSTEQRPLMVRDLGKLSL